MAKPTLELIKALRSAALSLRGGVPYAWGHHGQCNCGHLLQHLSLKSDVEILKIARTGNGEWSEIAEEYCPVSDLPVYALLTEMQKAGLQPTDVHHLEYLSDRAVLERLPGGFRWLKRNRREDVIDYFETYADWLEDQLANLVRLPTELFALKELDMSLEIF
jgi:hypothetical protein